MNKLLLVVAVLLSRSPAEAQEPVSHQVDFPKGTAGWTVVMQKGGAVSPASEAGAAETRVIKKIDIVRSGNLRRDVVLWNDQSSTEYWWSVNPSFAVFTIKPDGPILSMKGALMEMRKFDETVFSWISPSSFIGIQNFGGKPCRFYERKSVDPVTGGESTSKVWIDQETSLPAGWSDGTSTASFSFWTPPPESLPLVVPQKFIPAMRRFTAHLTPPRKAAQR